MSTVSEVRDAVKSTLEASISSLLVYDTVPDVTQVPCVVVVPRMGNYVIGMGNCVEWVFDLFVLVPRSPVDVSQDSLDAYLDSTGASSIPYVVKSNPGLGLDDIFAQITEMTDYGGEYKAAQVDHIGAQLALKVLVTQ
jgi:hypothetical protein